METEAIMQAVVAILAALMLGSILYTVSVYTEPFLGASRDPTLANMESLEKEINNLIARNDLTAKDGVPLSIEQTKSVVAFSQGSNPVFDRCYETEIKKPEQCGASSCICVYTGSPQDSADPTCFLFNRVSTFVSLSPYTGPVTQLVSETLAGTIETRYGIPAIFAANLAGGEIPYPPEIPRDVFPEYLSSVLFRGFCPTGAAHVERQNFNIQPLYLEKYESQNGFVHLLITPSTTFTKQRYEELKRGKTAEDYKKELEANLRYEFVCDDQRTMLCHRVDRSAYVYTLLRDKYSNEYLSDQLLLKLATLLREHKQEAAALRAYSDYTVHYPTGAGVSEARYYTARLTFPPETIKLLDLPPAVYPREKLLAAKEPLDTLISTGKKDVYTTHAHYLRALYLIALGMNAEALSDADSYLASFMTLSEQRAELAKLNTDLLPPDTVVAYLHS